MNERSQVAQVPSNGNHERWLAETWQMIEECAKQIDQRHRISLSPMGCAALLKERSSHETGERLASWRHTAMCASWRNESPEPACTCGARERYEAERRSQKASERRGTPEEEADWAEFGDCPRCWRCAAPVITIPGMAPGCIRNCPPSPESEGESR